MQKITAKDVELLSISATINGLKNPRFAYSVVWSLFDFVYTFELEVMGAPSK